MKMSNLQKYTIPLGIGEMKREIIQCFIQFQYLLPNSMPKFLFLRVCTGSQPTVLFSSYQTGKLLSMPVTTIDTPSTTCDLLSVPFLLHTDGLRSPLGGCDLFQTLGCQWSAVCFSTCAATSPLALSLLGWGCPGVQMAQLQDAPPRIRWDPCQTVHMLCEWEINMFGWPTKVVAK